MITIWRLTLVVVASAAVLLLGLSILARHLVRRLAHRSAGEGRDTESNAAARALRSSSSRQRGLEAAILAAAVAVVLAGVDAVAEAHWPEVVRVALPSPVIGRGKSVRIVQLSDLHSDRHVGLEDGLPALVAGLEPDLIVFTGDAVNHKAGVPHFRRTMTALVRIAPTFAVRGNWDVWWFADAQLFDRTGVRELRSEAVPVSVRDSRIWVAGVPVDAERQIPRVLAVIPPREFVLFLHHFPAAASRAVPLGADLVLAGDTHGGQARLPLLGELVRLSRFGVWRPLGLQREGEGWLYVNRGIGFEGSLPRLRLFCRPEVTVIDLTGTG